MKEHPILFNGEMVRAILGGRKTQTRRIMKPQPAMVGPILNWHGFSVASGDRPGVFGRYVPGDRLWVRETFQFVEPDGWIGRVVECPRADQWPFHPEDWRAGCRDVGIAYRADGEADEQLLCPEDVGWRPSIFMFRWAYRITLEVTDVRIEQIQDISALDAMWEGIAKAHNPINKMMIEALGNASSTGLAVIDDFVVLWDSINAKRGYSWESNPWVWVVDFERVSD